MVLVFLLLLLISTLWTEWSGTHLRLTEKLKFSKPCTRSPCASIWASSGYWIERSLRRLLWSSSGVFWQTLGLAVLQGWPNFPAVTSDIKPGVSFKISLPSVLFTALSARQIWLKPNRLHLTPWQESETVSLYRQERSSPNPWHICWWKDLWRTSVSVPAVPNSIHSRHSNRHDECSLVFCFTKLHPTGHCFGACGETDKVVMIWLLIQNLFLTRTSICDLWHRVWYMIRVCLK